MRSRLSDQHGDGVLEGGALNADVDGLRARGFEDGFRLGDVHGGSQTAVKTAFSQIERLLVGHDGGIQKLLLGVEPAQLKIIAGQFGVKA